VRWGFSAGWFHAVDAALLVPLANRQSRSDRSSPLYRGTGACEQAKALENGVAFNFVLSRSRSWALVSALGTASTGTAFERNIEPLATAPFATAEYGDWIVTAFKAGKPLIVDDMVTDVRFDESQRAAHLGLGIQAEAALPLLSNGNLVAMLVVHSAAPRAWSKRDLNRLRAVAERTWAAAGRAHLNTSRDAKLDAAFRE